MKKVFFIFLLFISISLFSDQIDLLCSYWDFYSQNYNDYKSVGLGMSTVAEIGSSSLLNMNPAGVDVEYQNLETTFGYKNKISLSDTLSLKPRYPILSVNYAFSYKKKYDFAFSFNTIKNFQIHNTSSSLNSYLNNKNLFYKENNYTLSANYKNIKYVRIGVAFIIKSILLDEETDAAYIDRFAKTVLLYKIGLLFTPSRFLNVGLTYRTGEKYDVNVLNADDETQSGNTKIIPEEINMGLKLKFQKIALYYQYEIEKTSKDFYMQADKLDHHIGVLYDLNSIITFSGGFFTNNIDYQYTNQNDALNLPTVEKEFFISGGILLKNDADNFDIGISVADSHFSNAYTPKTYIFLGFSYSPVSFF